MLKNSLNRENFTSRSLLVHESGSSTLEFIFCAPILVILMFVALEINERIEQRVTATIASGNSAWIVAPNSSNLSQSSESESLVKADILGTRSEASSNILDVNNSHVLTNSDVVMSYTETKRRADSYNLHLSHSKSSNSSGRAQRRSGTNLGNSTKDNIATGLALKAAQLTNTYKKIFDSDIAWIPSIFPQSHIEEQQLTWSSSESGSTNKAISTISELAKSLESNLDNTLQDPSHLTYRVLAHQSHYLRRDAGYHPDRYRHQALMGLAIGSSSFNTFVDDCFMKFVVDKNRCGQDNGFVNYVRRIYAVLVFGKTMIDTGVMSCIAASLGTGTAGCVVPKVAYMGAEELVSQAIDKLTSDVASGITQKVSDSVSEALSKMGDDFEKTIFDQIESIQNSIDAAVNKSLGTSSNE